MIVIRVIIGMGLRCLRCIMPSMEVKGYFKFVVKLLVKTVVVNNAFSARSRRETEQMNVQVLYSARHQSTSWS